MRTLFVGAGATGGYFGGLLASAGKDVTFLVRPGRAAVLEKRGLRIRDEGAETVVRPRLVTAVDSPYDLVVLAVKSYALEQALIDLAPAVGPRTVVVPLLNGMRHIDELVGAFGPERAWGGVCMVNATLDADGDVVKSGGMHRIGFGPLDGAEDDRLAEVTYALSGPGFDANPSLTIGQDMWEKWIFLAGLGAATTLMRGSIGAINAAPGGAGLAARIGDEALAVADAAGHPAREGAVALLRSGLASTEPVTSSMYRDLVGGRPVEADAILGDFLASAEVDAPIMTAAYTGLCIYSASRGS
jgi:2-dehydropantoate 2-reductase